jgi:hypothetical protein
MSSMSQNKAQLAKAPLKIFLGVGFLMIVATLALASRLWTAPTSPSSLINSVITMEPSASIAQVSPTATSTPFPTPSTASFPIHRMTVTPPANGQVITLTTTADAIGWASDLDGRSHFNVPHIHVGTYQGSTYYGVARFDLPVVPPGSTISFAALELVGLDDRHLGQGGLWHLNLLDTSLDEKWSDVNFAMLAAATSVASLPLDMNSNRLVPNNANSFIFDPQARAVLEQQLGQRNISFRLDGPNAAEDNLFSWHSGYSRQADASQMVVLSLVVIPAATGPDIRSSNDAIITSTPALTSGDVTGDGRVDILDLAFIAVHFQTTDSTADINADGVVDIFDLTIVASGYGQVVSQG